jgi:hypothetical protein
MQIMKSMLEGGGSEKGGGPKECGGGSKLQGCPDLEEVVL